jgi:hypothetical protein
MKKIIKHRLFTWFERTANPVDPSGGEVLTERIARMGEEADITNPDYVKRGEELDAFYTDKEAEAIRKGTYNGSDAEALYFHRNAMAGQSAPAQRVIQPMDDEGVDVAALDAEQLAEYIKENRLNVDQTVALAGDDVDSIEKVLDAENLATENEPRKGVTDRLEAKLSATTQS